MKRIAILGSTGSIGVNALKVIKDNPDKYHVVALTAGTNVDLLLEQIRTFRPSAAALLNESAAADLKKRLKSEKKPEVFFGLLPTYAAIKAGKNIALANKETMVMAGPLIMKKAQEQGVAVLPVDSEHSAIYQSLQGHPREDLNRVLLTASGGPFRDLPPEEMGSVTPKQALNHPNWNMGPKISIDSATMMNKGLEVIEAKWLFDLRIDQISILIHPQSVIHSMVEYKDGSIIAQLGVPDMMIPIAYALSFPHHHENRLPHLELERIGTLSFEKPDMKRFRCLRLALVAAETGETMPTVLNGANEIAVDAFLKGEIRFLRIPDLIEKTMEAHRTFPIDSIERVMEADRWARETAGRILNDLKE